MVLFLYSDKKYEYIATACIKSIGGKITNDVKIVYYTIGFKSDFTFKNLKKVEIEVNELYPNFIFYKPELALLTLESYPDEKYFLYSDSDILYSKRFDLEKMKHEYNYPMTCFGPFSEVFAWEKNENGEIIKFDEKKLMKYFNVPQRSMRYVPAWFFSFNHECKDFFEEWLSMCKNKYLLDRRKIYFPLADETSFNVCLWKRNVVQNYGFISINTNLLNIIKQVEENDNIKEQHFGRVDALGANWEYVNNSSDIVFYHGTTAKEDIERNINYLVG